MDRAPTVVEFYFGAGSRYSYLAATQLPALAAETRARFDWLPVDSTRLIRARGHDPFAAPGGAGQYDWDYRRQDAEAWAEFYGMPFREPHGRVALDPDLLSRACVAARRLGAVERYSQALFRAVFVDDLPGVDRAVCIARAGEVGLDPAAFAAALDGAEVRAEQDMILRQALDRGAFGVPTFVVGDRLFWGNDRLVLLRHHLERMP